MRLDKGAAIQEGEVHRSPAGDKWLLYSPPRRKKGTEHKWDQLTAGAMG